MLGYLFIPWTGKDCSTSVTVIDWKMTLSLFVEIEGWLWPIQLKTHHGSFIALVHVRIYTKPNTWTLKNCRLLGITKLEGAKKEPKNDSFYSTQQTVR